MYGSTLSSLDIKAEDAAPTSSKLSTFTPNKKEKAGSLDNLDSDLDQIKNWGPKFNKISNIYGLKSDDVDK